MRRNESQVFAVRGPALVGPALVVVLGVLATGCASSLSAGKGTQDAAPVGKDGSRMAVATAPRALHALAGHLLRYRAEHHRLPPTLAALPAEAVERLEAYAYHPAGLGMLPGDRRLVLVDSAVRIEDHLWCVVEPAASPGGARELRVMLVPLDVLEAVASSESQ